MDLVQLLDALVEKENELRADVIKRIENHRRWNENHVDLTCEPLGPAKDQNVGAGFRPVKTQYLMTPPASETSNEDGTEAMDLEEPAAPVVYQFKGVPLEANAPGPRLQFRRRIGRLNRLWIDRKRMLTPPRDVSPLGDDMDVNMVSDRWKYDADDSDDEPEVYEVDPYDTRALRFRASLPLPFPFQARRQELPANAAARAGGAAQPGRPSGQPRPPAAQPAAVAAATVSAHGTS